MEKDMRNIDQYQEFGRSKSGLVFFQENRISGDSGGSTASKGEGRSGEFEQDVCLVFGGRDVTENILEAKHLAVPGAIGNDQRVSNGVVLLTFCSNNFDESRLTPFWRDERHSGLGVNGGQINHGRLGHKVQHLVVQVANDAGCILKRGTGFTGWKVFAKFTNGSNGVLVVFQPVFAKRFLQKVAKMMQSHREHDSHKNQAGIS